MISTTVMILLGRIKGNKILDMNLSNRKLKNHGIEILMSTLSISVGQAAELLEQHKSIRTAMAAFESS